MSGKEISTITFQRLLGFWGGTGKNIFIDNERIIMNTLGIEDKFYLLDTGIEIVKLREDERLAEHVIKFPAGLVSQGALQRIGVGLQLFNEGWSDLATFIDPLLFEATDIIVDIASLGGGTGTSATIGYLIKWLKYFKDKGIKYTLRPKFLIVGAMPTLRLDWHRGSRLKAVWLLYYLYRVVDYADKENIWVTPMLQLVIIDNNYFEVKEETFWLSNKVAGKVVASLLNMFSEDMVKNYYAERQMDFGEIISIKDRWPVPYMPYFRVFRENVRSDESIYYDEDFFNLLIEDYHGNSSIDNDMINAILEQFLVTYPDDYGLDANVAIFIGGIHKNQIQGVRNPKKLLDQLYVSTREELVKMLSSRGVNNAEIEGIFKVITRVPSYFLLLLSTPRGYWELFFEAAERELEDMSENEICKKCVIPEVDLDASMEGNEIAFRILEPEEVKDWLVMAINELRKILL